MDAVVPLSDTGLEPVVPGTLGQLPEATPEPASKPAREVWFDDADAAYLVAAFVRQNLDVTVADDVVLVPTQRGPGLEIAGNAVGHRVVLAVIRRFGGHLGTPR